MLKEIECNIVGRVQTVLFRDFTRRNAKSLGLTGVVKNLEDGSVYVVAQGDEEKLNKLIILLEKGPMFAKVDNVDVRWREVKEKFEDFKIIWK